MAISLQSQKKTEKHPAQNLALRPDHSLSPPGPPAAKSTLATEKPALGAQILGIAHVFWMSPYNVRPSR